MLANKERELAETGAKFQPETAAKEIIKEYTASLQSGQTMATDDAAKKTAQILKNEPHAKQVDELLSIAQKNGVLSAVEVARHLKNPHLLDDFHDRLVFEIIKNKQ